ncbi:MAG: hypothetical protein MZU84_03120 [Sphingobacterium sp.]|nr:hypothetical protein [Sphingobacterium sp.]
MTVAQGGQIALDLGVRAGGARLPAGGAARASGGFVVAGRTLDRLRREHPPRSAQDSLRDVTHGHTQHSGGADAGLLTRRRHRRARPEWLSASQAVSGT